ncbi:MAG: hypothetical protein C7B45_04540 [Sulfobacillus acidophilus]|uniref:Sulfotransferase domain-containing protein n=1 Tax=Sulfobacillus acidophilus TaxID=53633 RepID=A0A2T2WLD2_9FIRM|nr:MAG: hypothetical protein C7B45_04540 [Sulfobacillus acidophilus]
MSTPNFFILGAPRSATTFLYRAVAQHPQIYMSPVKEPAFFSHDEREPKWITPVAAPRGIVQWADYLKLFDAGASYPVRGEASTGYLADAYAAQRIQLRLKEPPYMVAVLRHPADRAYSHYVYHRMGTVEPAPTFEEAIKDEDNRRAHHWNMQWRYRETGLYGQHLARYLDLFGSSRLLVLLHEEFDDAPAVFRRVFGFLGIDDQVPINLGGKVNESGVSKSSFAAWILQNRNPVKLLARKILPAAARSKLRHQLTDRPPAMTAQTRADLIAFYREDILRTQALIGRDLSAWLK